MVTSKGWKIGEIQPRRLELGTGEGVESEEVVGVADGPGTIVKRRVYVPGTANWERNVRWLLK